MESARADWGPKPNYQIQTYNLRYLNARLHSSLLTSVTAAGHRQHTRTERQAAGASNRTINTEARHPAHDPESQQAVAGRLRTSVKMLTEDKHRRQGIDGRSKNRGCWPPAPQSPQPRPGSPRWVVFSKTGLRNGELTPRPLVAGRLRQRAVPMVGKAKTESSSNRVVSLSTLRRSMRSRPGAHAGRWPNRKTSSFPPRS